MIKNTKHNEFKSKHFCPAQKLDLQKNKASDAKKDINYSRLFKAVKEA